MIDSFAIKHDLYSIQDGGRIDRDVLHDFVHELFAQFAKDQDVTSPLPPPPPPPPPTRFINNSVSPAKEKARYDAAVTEWKTATAEHLRKAKEAKP